MSKTTMPFRMPLKIAGEIPPPAPDHIDFVPEETAADEWVHRQEHITIPVSGNSDRAKRRRPAASSVTLTIGSTPNMWDLVKIGFVLPYLPLWLWTLAAVQKNLQSLPRYDREHETFDANE